MHFVVLDLVKFKISQSPAGRSLLEILFVLSGERTLPLHKPKLAYLEPS
jgi:hypothetical protein